MTHHSRLVQRGMTLIGAMVGLVVSMLIVLTMMSAYRSVVHLTAQSNADARQSGDLAAAFLFTHLNLSDAGRRIVNATRADDLLLCKNGELVAGALTGCDLVVSGSESGNAIFWRWGDEDDNNPIGPPIIRCAGLLALEKGQLDYLGPQNCDEPDFPLDGWASLTLVQPSTANLVEDYTQITFSVAAEPCRPLGAAASLVIKGGIAVTISSTHVGSRTQLKSTTCLLGLSQ